MDSEQPNEEATNGTQPEQSAQRRRRTPLTTRMALAGVLTILVVPPLTIAAVNLIADTTPIVNAGIMAAAVGAGAGLMLPGLLQLSGNRRRDRHEETGS